MKNIMIPMSLLLASCAAVHTKIEIDSPAENVENVLFDFDKYPEWNPFIREVRGEFQSGSKLKIVVKPLGKAPMEFHPIVLADSRQKASWKGRFLMPGIFTGEHEFIIEKLGPDKTRFHQNERFTGILVPFFGFGPTRGGFELMNSKLKERAEALAKANGN